MAKIGEFIDAESGFRDSKEDNFSFRIIALKHIKDILKLASVEFRGGFWQEKVQMQSNGVAVKDKFYVPDSREEYCNAIMALYDLIFPHMDYKEHENIQIESDYKLDEIEKARTDCLKQTEEEEKEIMSNEYYKGNDKKIVEEYRFKNLRLHRELFRVLSRFLKSEKYFEQSGFSE